MNPYFKTTKGYNAEVIVAKGVAYSAKATITAFADSAAEGEIGVFDAGTNALVTTAAAVGSKLFIAQKRDGAIHKTAPFTVSAGFGTYTPYTAATPNKWTVDATNCTAVKGDVLEVALIELTTAAQPYRPTNFDVTVKAGETVPQALARLAALISDPKSPKVYAYGQIATATVSGSVMTITATNADRFFKVIIRQVLADAVLTETVAPSLGSGSYEGIASLEAEGHIFDGVTTNYPLHGNPDEYGQATKFADKSKNYDVMILTPTREEASPLPFHKHTHKSYIVVAVPTTGTAPKAQLQTIFGFAAPVTP